MDTLKEESRDVFGPGKGKPASSASSTSTGTPVWSIVIIAFHSETQDSDAAAALKKVQTDGGLKDAYVEKRGGSSVVAYGRYDGPASPQGQADLERVRNIEATVSGKKTKPFAQSFMAPPSEVPGSIPEYDLRNAKKATGEWVLYTLQIGVYSREDGKEASGAEIAEFRKAAEQAVVQLRREGEQAYYFHGPRRSMVTVGLFGKDDYDPQTPGVESPTLHLLRQRYPYNLLNGMGVKQKLKITDPKTGNQVKKDKFESSVLVNVPKD
jgi:hypothetical protein